MKIEQELIWESILQEGESLLGVSGVSDMIFRAPIFGGWIVASQPSKGKAHIRAMIFVPDPKHEWDLSQYYGHIDIDEE